MCDIETDKIKKKQQSNKDSQRRRYGASIIYKTLHKTFFLWQNGDGVKKERY